MTLPDPLEPSFGRRLLRAAPVRILLGALAAVVPVAVSMNLVQHVVDKAHRVLWPQLLAAALCLLAYRAFVRRVERRDPDELAPQPAFAELTTGAVIGGALVALVCALLAAVQVLHVAGAGGGSLVRPLGDMALAAIMEEVLFRAVLLRILAGWLGTRAAFMASSLLFALAHLPNNGFSWLAFAALVVAGALLAAAYLARGHLWLPIGLHFGWNFTTEGVFGLASSGQGGAGALQTRLAGPDWLSGGAFGIEASVVTLVVTVVATAVLLALGRRRGAARPSVVTATATSS